MLNSLLQIFSSIIEAISSFFNNRITQKGYELDMYKNFSDSCDKLNKIILAINSSNECLQEDLEFDKLIEKFENAKEKTLNYLELICMKSSKDFISKFKNFILCFVETFEDDFLDPNSYQNIKKNYKKFNKQSKNKDE